MTDPQIIQALGGPSRVAEMCGLKRNSVHNWIGRGIPRAWRHKIADECRKRRISLGDK